jgi:hypothetical protein
VRILKELLARAVKGELKDFCYSATTSDNQLEVGYSGGALADPVHTLGALRMMEVQFSDTVRRQLHLVHS